MMQSEGGVYGSDGLVGGVGEGVAILVHQLNPPVVVGIRKVASPIAGRLPVVLLVGFRVPLLHVRVKEATGGDVLKADGVTGKHRLAIPLLQ